MSFFCNNIFLTVITITKLINLLHISYTNKTFVQNNVKSKHKLLPSQSYCGSFLQTYVFDKLKIYTLFPAY